MKKNFYEQPNSTVIEFATECLIAASIGGDAGGSGQDMPWGSNEESGYEDMPWVDNGED